MHCAKVSQAHVTPVDERLRLPTEHYEIVWSQGEGVQSGIASPEVIEELKALGNL